MQSLFDAPPDLSNWTDPNPAPVIQQLDEHTIVVRDDLLPGGTKLRALDYLIGHDPDTAHITDWVYGSSPAHGYAQWALALVCQRYGKRVHLFMAERAESTRHRLQTLGLSVPSATYHWVPNGMLSVTEKRARDFVAESPDTRRLIPIGGDVPSATQALMHVMQSLVLPWEPTHIWSVISSGTLSRALQGAYPSAVVYGVIVGHEPTPEQAGRALLWRSSYPFAAPVKAADMPPYPSVPEYDAKLWPLYRLWRISNRKWHNADRTSLMDARVLIWNVGA